MGKYLSWVVFFSTVSTCAFAAQLKLPDSIDIPYGAKNIPEMVSRGVSAAPNWTVEDQRPNALLATYDNGKHIAKVWLVVKKGQLVFKYGGSKNLDCRPMGDSCKKIHSAYNQWSQELAAALVAEFDIAQYSQPSRNRTSSLPAGAFTGSKDEAGMCFAINGEGKLLTNYHLIRGQKSVRVVMADGRLASAAVVAFSEPLDLAILDTGTATKYFLRIESARGVGQKVYIPVLGQTATYTIAEIDRLNSGNGDGTWLQIRTPVSLPVSGGPVVDELGNVVAIVSVNRTTSDRSARSQHMEGGTVSAVKAEFAQLLYREPFGGPPSEKPVQLLLESLCQVNTENGEAARLARVQGESSMKLRLK